MKKPTITKASKEEVTQARVKLLYFAIGLACGFIIWGL